MKKILNEVLKEIKPSKKEEAEIKKEIKKIIDNVNKGAKGFKAVLGGSGAKGTWLKVFDIDIFVKFNYKDYKDKSNVLSDILEKHLKKKFKGIVRLHGSRDYFRLKKGKYLFEIVPILDINKASDAVNITDVSPLHADWVKKHVRHADDIRLLKQFCKANNFYGAESYIKGFSGYVCEILVVHYGSFIKVLRNSVRWKDKQVIDTARYYKGANDVFFNLNSSKLHSPLIIIDPVQKDRNAAAALSRKQFLDFKIAASLFLKNPSAKFFEQKDVAKEIKNKAGKDWLVVVDVIPLAGKDDTVGCKLLKVFEYIIKKIERNDFIILEKRWWWDKSKKASFYLVIKKQELSKDKKWVGPPAGVKGAEDFKKKYKKTFVEGGRLVTFIKRKYAEPLKLIKEVIKDDYVKEKVKSIKVNV